jgi:hypothetical protein
VTEAGILLRREFAARVQHGVGIFRRHGIDSDTTSGASSRAPNRGCRARFPRRPSGPRVEIARLAGCRRAATPRALMVSAIYRWRAASEIAPLQGPRDHRPDVEIGGSVEIGFSGHMAWSARCMSPAC